MGGTMGLSILRVKHDVVPLLSAATEKMKVESV